MSWLKWRSSGQARSRATWCILISPGAPEFYASLLNNQPMGLYTSATIVRDAQRHGVKVKPVCVMQSDWRCTVVDDNTFRLGLCVVNGLREEHSEELIRQRQDRQFE